MRNERVSRMGWINRLCTMRVAASDTMCSSRAREGVITLVPGTLANWRNLLCHGRLDGIRLGRMDDGQLHPEHRVDSRDASIPCLAMQ